MPVTAKLSRQFYDKLGDAVANELVEWLNQMDAQYKGELRELAEGYFKRFEADLRAELWGVRADQSTLRADLRSDVSSLRAELLKWMFLFWVGHVAATVGIVFAALKLSR